MNPFIKEHRNEIRVLMIALFFAAIGDLFYGGVEGAGDSLVGVVLSSASALFSAVFFIMVIFKLVMRFFVSDNFHDIVIKLPCPEPESKTKRARTSSRRIKRK